jgi:transcriptional regulator with XRE-family HTH domain
LAVEAGAALRAERLRRRLSLEAVAELSGLGRSTVHRIDSGDIGSVESYVRISTALSLKPELLFEGRRSTRQASRQNADLVHAAMGELEAAHFGGFGFAIALDEPYQHYQFAGRADFLAWDLDRRALLHVENRTQFPNLQDAAGSFNAKRAYLPRILADRLSVRGGWLSVTHAIVALWPSEVLHVARLRTSTLAALCPDELAAFEDWWRGDPAGRGSRSVFVLFDPAQSVGRSRRFIGLDAVPRAEPRYRDYAEAAAALRRGH